MPFLGCLRDYLGRSAVSHRLRVFCDTRPSLLPAHRYNRSISVKRYPTVEAIRAAHVAAR
jgi:hypothetical protein